MSKRVCFSTLLIYFVVMCLFVVLRICSHCNVFSFLGDYSSLVLSLVTQVLLIALFPILTFKKANDVPKEGMKNFLNLRKTSCKVLLLAVVLGVVVFFVNSYVSTFFNSIIRALGYSSASSSSGAMSVGTLILELLTTALLPAVCEELLHRGMLLSGTSSLGLRKSIIVSGLLFGLLHFNIEQVFYASIIGLFLGYLCCGCNSIYPCMIVHFMNNAMSVLGSFFTSRGVNFLSGITNFVSSNHVLGILFVILFLIFLLFAGYELVQAMFKESFKFNFSNKQKEISAMAIRENFFSDVERIKNGEAENEKIYSAEKNIVRIDLEQFLQIVSKNLEEVKAQQPQKEAKISARLDLKIKILLWGSFLLGVIVNIMTFVWGMMR